MQITFLGHCGFAVDTGAHILLFDYAPRRCAARAEALLPGLLRGRAPLVFVSHAHRDHYCEEIWNFPEARYFLGSGVPTRKDARVFSGGETFSDGTLTLETFPSTDEGVAFLVRIDGHSIYHAGDLHWWHWEGEPKADNGTMAANFKAFTEPLRGRRIDLAFVPLDGRLKEAEDWGLRYLLDLAELGTVIPMHQWEDYSPTERFLQKHPEQAGHVLPVTREPQSWEL